MNWNDDDEFNEWQALKELGAGVLLVVLVVATGYCAMFLR